MNIIGNRIREARKLKGLAQEELAELSKVNLRTIQRIENNMNEPRGKTLNLICEVLELNLQDLLTEKKIDNKRNYGILVVEGFFLVIINLVIIGIFGYLTLDSQANINSRFGGILLSIFLTLFIVWKTQAMNGLERMLKFGMGSIYYIILVIVKLGFPTGFVKGLFPCLVISLAILFYGGKLIRKTE